MAGTDHVKITVRERPLSDDINDLQSLLGRSLCDVLRFMMSQEVASVTPVAPLSTPANVVLGGLVVSPSGTDLLVSPGALLQDSATVPSAPGALDSTYRVGVLRAAATVATVVPGSDTYYLLQAQVSEVVTVNESRDVLNAVTGSFVPTLVDKQVERRITFNLKAGTATEIPAADADWIPIAGLFRPMAGGAITTAQIFDLRPKWNNVIARPSQVTSPAAPAEVIKSYMRGESNIVTNTLNVTFDFEVVDAYGRRLFARSNGMVDLSTLDVQTAQVVPSASGTIWYIYLAAPGGYALTNRYTNVVHRGIVFLSQTAPNELGVNAAGISVTNPAGSPAAGEAVCVGAIISRGTGFRAITQVGRQARGEALTLTGTGALPGPISYGAGIPLIAKTVLLRVSGVNAVATGDLRIRPVAASGAQVMDVIAQPVDSWSALVNIRTDAPATAGNQFEVEDVGGNTSFLAVSLMGWDW